ncbi:MAG: DUF4214 domain-containing protein [Telluria sp.]
MQRYRQHGARRGRGRHHPRRRRQRPAAGRGRHRHPGAAGLVVRLPAVPGGRRLGAGRRRPRRAGGRRAHPLCRRRDGARRGRRCRPNVPAVPGRVCAHDPSGLGYWIAVGDGGADLAAIAQSFIDTGEFTALCGKLDNAGFVAHLYRNVLGREPDGAGLAFHVGLLDSGATARNQTLAAFSESPENQAGLVGVIGNGVAYTPFG